MAEVHYTVLKDMEKLCNSLNNADEALFVMKSMYTYCTRKGFNLEELSSTMTDIQTECTVDMTPHLGSFSLRTMVKSSDSFTINYVLDSLYHLDRFVKAQSGIVVDMLNNRYTEDKLVAYVSSISQNKIIMELVNTLLFNKLEMVWNTYRENGHEAIQIKQMFITKYTNIFKSIGIKATIRKFGQIKKEMRGCRRMVLLGEKLGLAFLVHPDRLDVKRLGGYSNRDFSLLMEIADVNVDYCTRKCEGGVRVNEVISIIKTSF